MSVRNGIVLLVALSTLLFLAACGGNGTSIANRWPRPAEHSAIAISTAHTFSPSPVLSANGAPYAMVGTFTANGSGGNGKGSITAGTLTSTIAPFSVRPPAGVSITSGSTYSVSCRWPRPSRHRNQHHQWTPGQTFPLTFDFVLRTVLTDSSRSSTAFGSGSGTLDLQASNTTPTGTYAFSFSGADPQRRFLGHGR